MTPSTPLPTRLERVHGFTLTLLDLPELELLLVDPLADDLHVRRDRLRAAVLKPDLISQLGTCSLWAPGVVASVLAINRMSVAVLANRLRPGDNAQLKLLMAVAQEIAIPLPDSLIVRKARSVKREIERRAAAEKNRRAMEGALVKAYDVARQHGFASAVSGFTAETGRHPSVMTKFFNQAYPTRSAAQARKRIEARDGAFKPALLPRGRPPKLTMQQLDEAARLYGEGHDLETLAAKYDLSVCTLERHFKNLRFAQCMQVAEQDKQPNVYESQMIYTRAERGETAESIGRIYGLKPETIEYMLERRAMTQIGGENRTGRPTTGTPGDKA
jgi:hypothetical protein